MNTENFWFNEPGVWSFDGDKLLISTNSETDFWRKTHYGFTHDSGHFYAANAGGAFTAQVKISAVMEELYDQAGLMVRINSDQWIKAGVEFNDNKPYLSVVMTNGYSDWSTGIFLGDIRGFWIRVTVAEGLARVQASTDGRVWPLVRLATFPKSDNYLVGPMACSPKREGLMVEFSEFSLTPPNGKPLHDLT